MSAKWAFWAGIKFNSSKCKLLIITPKRNKLDPNRFSCILPIYRNITNKETETGSNPQHRFLEQIETKLKKNNNLTNKQVNIILNSINDWTIFVNMNETNGTLKLNKTNTFLQNIDIVINTNLVQLNITQNEDGCKYLGIIQQNGSTYVKQRNKSAANSKAAMCKVMNFEEIGDANNVGLSLIIYQTITRSVILIGSETLTLPENFIDSKLESIQHKSLCFIFGVFLCVNKAFLRLIAGLPPIIAIWHQNRIKAFFKIIANVHELNSIATKTAREDLKLFMIEMSDNNNKIAGTMTDEIWELIVRYKCKKLFHNICNSYKVTNTLLDSTLVSIFLQYLRKTVRWPLLCRVRQVLPSS